ncbi:YjbQ family protein [Planctomycetota bacterium]|nr:YjbQ family protein [Planctomycetota bacterium]
MATYQDQIQFSTRPDGDMHDITEKVQSIVRASNINTGIAHVFNVGSTAVIGTIEYEPGLIHDLPAILNKLMPPSKHYGHEQTWHDGNGHSHLQASTLGPSETIPIANNQLILGTWQQIFHLECDNKPRNRTIIVTITGD